MDRSEKLDKLTKLSTAIHQAKQVLEPALENVYAGSTPDADMVTDAELTVIRARLLEAYQAACALMGVVDAPIAIDGLSVGFTPEGVELNVSTGGRHVGTATMPAASAEFLSGELRSGAELHRATRRSAHGAS